MSDHKTTVDNEPQSKSNVVNDITGNLFVASDEAMQQIQTLLDTDIEVAPSAKTIDWLLGYK